MIIEMSMRSNWLNNIINPIWVISLPLFGALGYLAAHLFETTILFWQISFIVSLLIVGASLLYFRPDLFPEKVHVNSLLSRMMALLPLLIFATGLYAVWSSTDLQVSHNGDLHTAYTVQILFGKGTPENSFIPGYPANYYWLYHALLAVLTSLLNVPIPVAATLLNTIVLFLTIGWAVHTLHLLIERPLSPIVVVMLAIFLVFGSNIFGFVPGLGDVRTSGFSLAVLDPRAPYGPGLIKSVLYKFYNFTSFDHAVMYQWVTIYGVTSLLKRGWSNNAVLFIITGLTGIIMFELIGPLFFVSMTLFLGLVIADIVLEGLSNRRRFVSAIIKHYHSYIQVFIKWLESKQSRLVIAYSLVTVLPMLLYLFEFLNNFTVERVSRFPVYFFKQPTPILYIFGMFYPLLPFVVIGVVSGIWQRDRILTTISFLAVSAMLVYYSTNWVTPDTYKFFLMIHPYLTMITIVVLDAFFLRIIIKDQEHKISALIPVVPFLFFAMILHVLPLNAAYQVTADTEHNYVYEGTYVDMPNAPYNSAWIWIRNNTPINTIVLMPHEESRYATLVNFRLSYAMDHAFLFVDGIPEYDQRVSAMQLFMQSDSVGETQYQEALDFIRSTLAGRPAVFIIPISSSFTQDIALRLGLEWLHNTENADIYGLME